jgi:hypothetical protein
VTPLEQREAAVEMIRDHAEIPSYGEVYPFSSPDDQEAIDNLIATATISWPEVSE